MGKSQSTSNPSQTTNPKSGDSMSKVNQSTTIAQLIELGLMKASQVDAFNKRLARKASKAQDSEQQQRANKAVAMYIGKTYGLGRDNKFRMKPIEKALLSFGISRRNIEVCVKQLVDDGVLANNKGEVANNCHVRHWRVESVKAEPVVQESQPESQEESEE